MTASMPYDTMSTTSRTEPLFTRCCFCVPLRIGCFILGYMNLVFNIFHTLALLTVTMLIGITTHGFDHFDSNSTVSPDQTLAVESIERPILNQIGILLIVVLCANIAWLVINIACLVGLHRKRPGPIRVYVGFAIVRLLLVLAGFVYQMTTASANTKTIISHSFGLGLAAYFILVYYIYAMQLEREQEQNKERQNPMPDDIAFVYPTKLDKQILVA